MIIPDICNVLSTSGKEFSLSHWYSPIIDSLVAKIEVQRKHLFQIFRIYWIDSLFHMQVFWDLWIRWSNCPYFVAKKDLNWIHLVEKGKSGFSCQDAKFRSTPNQTVWFESLGRCLCKITNGCVVYRGEHLPRKSNQTVWRCWYGLVLTTWTIWLLGLLDYLTVEMHSMFWLTGLTV